jgi:hypothetical protein
MNIDDWWDELEPSTQEWLIDNNGDVVPPEVIQEILDAGGSLTDDAGWVGERTITGFFLSDEAVDWIEAKANEEDPERG